MSKKNFVSLILGTVGGTVNTKVGEIAGEVGMTPAGWNGGIFNMIRGLSETVIVPIAGIRLFRVADIVNGRFQRPLDRMRLTAISHPASPVSPAYPLCTRRLPR